MHRILTTIVCFFVLLLFRDGAPAFQQQSKDSRPQIRVEVEAVNVLVSITDQKGKFVTELTQDRFRIYENGVPQRITNFSRQSNLPLTIALLIDTSASVRLRLDFEKKAATDFLHAVMQPHDRALLVEFDTGVSLLHDFTSSPGALAKEIKSLRAGGGTSLFDALYVVCREKFTDTEGRKAMVIVSDGMDVNSKHSMEEALEIAQKSNGTVYTIGTIRFGADPNQKGEAILKKLAEETGGSAFFPYSAEQLETAFDLINEELRSQYNLAYVPTNKVKDGRFREIEVKIHKSKGLNVHHRKGYFAPTA